MRNIPHIENKQVKELEKMKAGKLKKVLFLVLSLSLSTMLTVMNVHATESIENESANQEQVIVESEKEVLNEETVIADEDNHPNENTTIAPDSTSEEAINKTADPMANTDQNKLWVFIPHISDGQRLEVSKGSNIDNYGIEVGVVNADHKFEVLPVKLTSDMVSGFDNMTLGEQDVTITFEGLSDILEIKVIDGQASGEAVAIKLDKSNIAIPVGGYAGTSAQLLNPRGETIENVAITPDMIPGLDNTTVGTRQYLITYKGFTATLTVEVANMIFKTQPQTIPIGGKLNVWEKVQIVDAANPTRIFDTDTIIHVHNNENPAWYDKIDTTKAGVQNVTFQSAYGGSVRLSGTIQITVGTPSQMTVDKLPTKAQATMPDGSYVGTWNVPSGKAGAGTWTFQTDLQEGTEVVVWSFHNNEWIKIGVYKVDAFGFVTVTFTADQLSPILITKNDGNSGSEISNNTVSNNNSDSNVTTRTASPKTGDNASAMLFGITALLSLALSTVVYLKRKKLSA